MSLTSKDVLKPLSQDFPKNIERQVDRIQKFISLLMTYRAERIGGPEEGSDLLLIGEAQKELKHSGVVAPKLILKRELERAGYYNTTKAPAASVEDIEISRQARIEELLPVIKSVLEHPDPLALAVKDIQACGYAGDTGAVEATYVGVTTRVLPIQKAQMPMHEAHAAESGEGKTYAAECVLAELPSCAWVQVNPGSPRAFIYGDDQLEYRVLFFPEIDTLPEGDDQPLSTAIRTLLQNGECSYDVVEKDPVTNKMLVRRINRVGPTTLLTTTTRSLDGKQGSQMDTRLFTMTLPETTEQHAAALKIIAALANEIAPRVPDPALLAFQEYLQLLAPWHVFIPYSGHLAALLAPSAARGRIMRDFARLLSFIKGVAILRHAHRERTPEGAVIATLDDYATARRLLNQVFVGSTTGAPNDLRLVVNTVAKRGPTTVADVQQVLKGKVGASSVYRYVTQALKQGWIVNEGDGKSASQWKLTTSDAEDLPQWAGLPTVEELANGKEGAAGDTVEAEKGSKDPSVGQP